ncbi:MAG TPA: hypothetical protein DCR35_05850 [Runella sp.]|nr:hypothetical protein [Runella sp.]HAO48846.1 hypothetical protein [Runella sp.]
MKTKTGSKVYFLKTPRTYSAEEIIAGGGTTNFGRQTGYNPKKLYEIKGKGLSEDEVSQALKMLSK